MIRFLAWVGLVRLRGRRVVWPFRVMPRWMWLPLLRERPLFAVFRNRPGVVSRRPGRLLPRRWGFRFWIFEIGDRG